MDLLQRTAALPGGSGQWTFVNALPHCLGAVSSGPPAIHCLTAWGQWAVDLLQYTGGSLLLDATLALTSVICTQPLRPLQ